MLKKWVITATGACFNTFQDGSHYIAVNAGTEFTTIPITNYQITNTLLVNRDKRHLIIPPKNSDTAVLWVSGFKRVMD